MRHSFGRLGFPLALAASAALIGTAGSAFAANHTKLSVTGTISAVSMAKGQVRIDGQVLTAVPRVVVQLKKLGSDARVTLKLNAQDKIVGIIKSDHYQNHIETGTVTGITASTITLGSTTYNLASGVVIRYGPFMLPWSQVTLNTKATVALNNSGAVDAVWLHADSSLPPRPMLFGNISAVTSNSITIDGYTLPVSSSVVVKADNQTLSFSQVAANQRAVVRLDSAGTVKDIQLLNHGAARGTVTADTSSSITINGTAYTYAANARIHYRQYTLSASQVPVGSMAVVQLNALGQADQVQLINDAALPKTNKVSGTVSQVSGTSITINSYTLPLASSMTVTYEGATSLTNGVTTGEDARASLNGQGQVNNLTVGTSLLLGKH